MGGRCQRCGSPGSPSGILPSCAACQGPARLPGGVVHTSHWLLDTSIFFHMVPAPATSPDWPSMAVITGLGILGAVLGGLLLCRRDQQTA